MKFTDEQRKELRAESKELLDTHSGDVLVHNGAKPDGHIELSVHDLLMLATVSSLALKIATDRQAQILLALAGGDVAEAVQMLAATSTYAFAGEKASVGELEAYANSDEGQAYSQQSFERLQTLSKAMAASAMATMEATGRKLYGDDVADKAMEKAKAAVSQERTPDLGRLAAMFGGGSTKIES